MSRARITSQAGFTLIEVGIAALVLVVAFIGMIRALAFSSSLMDHARRQTIATQILTHEIEQLRLRSWAEINALPTTASLTVWNAATAYVISDLVIYNGTWRQCIVANTGIAPTEDPDDPDSFWSTYSGPIADTGISDGATFTVSRTATPLSTHAMREVTFTVTWTVVSGRRKADNTPLIFTYSRVNTAYFGKNGLNLTYQRS
jgi:Tfp pilus assembly protein PilV